MQNRRTRDLKINNVIAPTTAVAQTQIFACTHTNVGANKCHASHAV